MIRTKHGQRGATAVETALGMLAFLLMIFYWIEVSYMGFVSGLVDMAVSEASRDARTVPSHQYHTIFNNVLRSSNSIWSDFVDPGEFSLQTRYYKSVQAITAEDCEKDNPTCNPQQNAPIAVYSVSYPYQPILGSLIAGPDFSMDITREVITIQEYERDMFK
ncbi:TadE/TadG family type IV pilus assembly protein [Endozoicomonadaceae bacterium StTr2]